MKIHNVIKSTKVLSTIKVLLIIFQFSFFLFFEFVKSEDYVGTNHKVTTESGNIVGTFIKSEINLSVVYAAFIGVPYARPPINHLRFKPSELVTPWKGDAIAQSEVPCCIQLEKGNVIGEEDCLYLNIYGPNIENIKLYPNKLEYQILLPVMVWIHGGEFSYGNASRLLYGPEFLLEEDVIVVSIQYRLGPFGFLNLNHPNASGNLGLKDQNLALQWINKNIKHFGGDSNQITLLGYGAGGVAVNLHKLSDMSRDLFKNTISMSASPLCSLWAFQSNSDAETQAFELGKRLGISTDDKDNLLSKLLEIPASQITAAARYLLPISFRPTLENSKLSPKEPKFLTECVPKKYRKGNYHKGPHLMGFTSAEVLSKAKTRHQVKDLIIKAKKIINEYQIHKLPFMLDILSAPFRYIEFLEKNISNEVIQALSDLYFVTGIDYKQKLLNIYNKYSVYYYRFSFKSIYSAHQTFGIHHLDGVGHEDDLAYLFHRPLLNLPQADAKIEKIRKRLVRMWTNFAKTGNPTPDGMKDPMLRVIWPPSGDNGLHLEIGDTLGVANRPTTWLIDWYHKIGLGDTKDNDCF